ncbi:MAG TPA: small multi-drug export protein [Thermoleophilia bacterium]|nr:small multi-drug export protein [Thermoleophilia bacterium]
MVEAGLQLLSVAAIAIVELWAAIPAGIAMGLPAPLVWTATVCGALTGIAVVVFAGDRLRTWLVARFGHGGARPGGRLRHLWDRYGVIGWGLLAPLLLGAPLAAAIGVALGAARGRLVFWLGVGAVAWTTVLTVVALLGEEAVRRLV